MDAKDFSRAQVLKQIGIYFLLFLAGDLLTSLVFDVLFSAVTLPVRDLYMILRMAFSLPVTYLLFWLYTTKALRLEMSDFGITFAVRRWGILCAVLLPAFVAGTFMLLGDTAVQPLSDGDIFWIFTAALFLGAKSGIVEEMLFRGYMMRLLEKGWGRSAAIWVPSVLFALLHVPSMETFSVAGVLLLAVSGTLVGVMFSLAAYRGNSISNSALIHGVWNFVMITDILHITTAQEAYGAPLISVILPSDNIFLTGGGFGIEASVIAAVGYLLACGFICFAEKKGRI